MQKFVQKFENEAVKMKKESKITAPNNT